MLSCTTKFNHLCTGWRIEEDIDDFVSLVFILVAPCHSLISIHTQVFFYITKLKFFTPFSKILWFRFPIATLILRNALVLLSTVHLDFCCLSTVMEFCRQQCKRTAMENSWGANFQCNYQQMGIQNACITLPMNKAPHGKEHIFHIWIINSTKIEHFVCR